MTLRECVTGTAVVALALSLAAESFVCDRHTVAKSEQALDETSAHILTMLEDRYGTNWNKVQQVMDAKHGPEWTNQWAPEQWLTLHELRHRFAEHRD
jgi:hypothetical protein